MSKKITINKKSKQKIASQRISKLFNMAEKAAHSGRIHLANRYVEIARKISMRYLVSIPKEYKRRYCKNCYHYLFPGFTCNVRINNKRITIHCFNCKKIMRFPLK